MSKLTAGIIGLVISMLLVISGHAHASVTMDDDSGVAKFRVKGTTKVISAMEAQRLAIDHEIEQGKPIKNAMTEDGKAAAVYQWKEVTYNCKAKSGNCSWKRK
jgi:hypothetical protein